MSGPGAVPPPIPPEVLDEERERIRKQLEIERGKSRVLYEKAYQSYLRGVSVQPTGEQTQPVSEPDYLAQVRRAYGDAYALRAFREVMDETTKPGRPAPQTMPSADNITTSLMKSGLPPQVVNEWLKTLDPEALGALVALSNQNPTLSPMLFALSQRGSQQQLTIKDVIELNAALSKRDIQPNISIDIPKLVEAVKAQPPAADPEKIVNATLTAIQTGMSLATPKGGGGEEHRPRGILEQILAQPDGAKVAKEIGLIGGDAPYLQIMAEMRKNDQQFQERMRTSDRAWDLRLEEMKLRSNIERAKMMEGRRRTELIAGSLRRIGAAVARGLAEGAGPEGEGKKTEEGAEEGPQETQCECGAAITIPPETKPGAIITCAKCGATYEATRPEAPKK
jgi:hypothetical protein